MSLESLPTIIQGGMGAGVSGWRLAQAVCKSGQLGVVSGTGLDVILIRRLQVGDPGGHVRRALQHLPLEGVAERILGRFFVPGGKARSVPFKSKPLPMPNPSRHLEELLVAGNFVEVFLAKEGHERGVGINYLEKIQLPTLPSLYGAMLAGVSWVLMGAGIPKSIPGILDSLTVGDPVELRLDVRGTDRSEEHTTRFDPRAFVGGAPPQLDRPKFLAIISSSTLATMLKKRSNGTVDGFVVEGPTAGGHNAPPRGQVRLEDGEPVYGERDAPDLDVMRRLGLPFWLAGSYTSPERVIEAQQAGAVGVQVGTAFAYCDESDLDAELKERVLGASRLGVASVFTDPVASPTGFPFKVVQLGETLSDSSMYDARARVCDLGYLRHAYKKENGELGWRCPAEPVADYVRKGGDQADTVGRKCVCNALMANIGMGQTQRGGEFELPLLTSGNEVARIARFVRNGSWTYSAHDVVSYLLGSPSHVEPDVVSGCVESA